jgi:hypothetical protein
LLRGLTQICFPENLTMDVLLWTHIYVGAFVNYVFLCVLQIIKVRNHVHK